MTDAFRSVARGLRVVHTGYLLTCWGATGATVLVWLISNMGYSNDELRLILWIAFWGNIVIGVGGAVSGIVGRVKCLSAPPEYPAVRGRALAAVVLEGSGWLSGFVGVGVLIAMGYKVFPQEPWVPLSGLIFSALLLVCGRILFLRFLRVLARVVDDAETDRRAKHSLAFFLADWAAGLVGTGIAAGGASLSMYELTTPLAFVVYILGGMSGLVGLVLYDRVLGGLTKSVRTFADGIADDGDEEQAEGGKRTYRSRHPVADSEDPEDQDRPLEHDTDDRE